MTIKKGDNVIIKSGKDQGKTGKILKSFPGTERVVVEGLNLRQRRIKPRRAGEKGQTVENPHPMHVSNVALFCSSCKQGVRVKMKISGKEKTRLCAKCGKAI